ncbi:hypothetical protein ERJ75_001342400 [Trypanosoma vivax]|uniref:Transmembrane protein n=1 Tax=Trypanosoma vivax (strain Y486) TaxID=1055687 RepID=G0U5Y9_TRYVY|nr:hypothetical protein ERJ75_001342400 [Trypanosoma vivax]CCC51290.1 conserved hypothetical protein [Trypanosoma vivax Y486]
MADAFTMWWNALLLFSIVQLQLIPGASAAHQDMSLPECNSVEPFTLQNFTRGAGVRSKEERDEYRVTCSLSPNSASFVLLGSSDGRLQSPLRKQVAREMSQKRQNDAESLKTRFYRFLVHRPAEMLHHLASYPWSSAAVLERLFLQRQLSLRLNLDYAVTASQSTESMSARMLLNVGKFHSIRMTSFAPMATYIAEDTQSEVARDVVRLSCTNSAHLFEEHHRSYQQPPHVSLLFPGFVGDRGERRESPFSKSSRIENDMYVIEELGHYRGSGLWVPVWLSAWFGRRPMTTISEKVVRDSDGHYAFVFETQLPAVTPVCLRLSSENGVKFTVELEESVAFDVFWFELVALFLFVGLVKPWVEVVPALQILVAGAGSIAVIFVFGLLLVLRKLQNMTLGKLGFIAVVTVGGMSALADTLTSAIAAVLYNYIHYDSEAELFMEIILALAVIALGCGLFAHYMWPNHLLALTRWTLLGIHMGILSCAALQNREATLLFTVTALLLHPIRLFRVLRWCSRSSALENSDNDPLETIPSVARREVQYSRPLCAEGFVSNSVLLNSEDRLKVYEALGNEYTKRALSHLAKHMVKNPERLASRLSDPEGALKWAKEHQDAER